MNPIEALMETATPLQRKLLEGCKWVPETGCWEWVGNKSGVYDLENKVVLNPRTVSFTQFIGPLVGSDIATPNCGNRHCIAPTHQSPKQTMPPGYWTIETCKQAALKYNNITRFARANPAAYNAAMSNGWGETVLSHMVRTIRPSGYWSKERCAEEALKYNTITDFQKYCKSGYNKIIEKGWWDDLCSHISYTYVREYWDKGKCAEEALKYTTRGEFQKGSSTAYTLAVKEGYLDEICNHMPKRKVKWTKERCFEIASRCESRVLFKRESGSAYQSARKNGWLDEFFPKIDS